MKFFTRLTIVFLMTVILVSCNKDDDNNAEPTLIGSWKLEGVRINGQSQDVSRCELKTTLKFSQKTVEVSFYEGENCEDVFVDTENYSRNGNILTVGSDSEATVLEISKLTDSTLEITDQDGSDIYIETYSKK